MDSQEKIPSVISYSRAPNGERQFGADISAGAVTMMNCKLELEAQEKRLDELNLILQLLEGVNNLSFNSIKHSGGDPEYSYKAPSGIITDYLSKVYQRAWEVIKPVYEYSTSRPPVDIVVTVPVVRGSPPHTMIRVYTKYFDRNGRTKLLMRRSEQSRRLASTKRTFQLSII